MIKQVDWNTVAKVCGYENPRSAQNKFSKVKKDHPEIFGSGNETITTPASKSTEQLTGTPKSGRTKKRKGANEHATPSKKSRKNGKQLAKVVDEDGDDDEEPFGKGGVVKQEVPV